MYGRNALNYNPEANYNQGCEYMDESDDANGTFLDGQEQGEIQAQINALFDAVKGLERKTGISNRASTPQPDLGAGYYDPLCKSTSNSRNG